ncbi:glycosyltransferase family 2 protein [Chryseobacterium flavum]|uniref:glycosyltransferase family 2 protein n=1 Tax=Chryseobacterium flavum TaxID=415851 RepID=UPI0028A9FF8D|nr:glycosyltransferase family 2 protein [Chryseobacterium flavum]
MQELNNILSISIPTYNRADILEDNLNLIIDECRPYNIGIYIFDDSTNNETELLISRLNKKYSYIFYTRNEPRLGHDKNCIKCLSIPNQQYIWYLGDSMIISKQSIIKILNVIKTDTPDFICFKEKNRNINTESKIYNDSKDIFTDLAWHLTMTGATIYKKGSLNIQNFEVDKFINFPQLAIIFCNFENKKTKLYWIADSLIYGNLKKKSYWNNVVFKVFFDDLKKTFSNLPQMFSEDLVDDIVKKHSVKSRLFSYHGFVRMRIDNALNYNSFVDYKKNIKKYTNLNIFLIKILVVFPRSIIRLLYRVLRLIIPEKKQIL